jgi:hypothetical protein
MVEGPVPGQADAHDGHDGTVPEPAGGCQPPGRLNELAAMDVYMVEMPTDRHRPNLVAVLAVLALLAGACTEPGPPGPAVAAPPDRTPERVRRALAALTRGWSALPPPPAAPGPGAVTVWTGTHLFLWGGEDGRGRPARGGGWLFDPVGRRWRATAATALPGRSRPAVAWTGQEVLVWGGDVEGRSFGDGAAYHPARDTWRALPPAPIPARAPAAWAWTGRELLVWGSTERGSRELRDGAAYDPEVDSWRPLAQAPLALNQATSAWTGRELLIVGSWLDGNNHSRTPGAAGLGYDPAGDTWRELPAADLSAQASAVAWTGRELLAWDYELRASAYDPAGDRWRRLDPLPLGEAECYPQSAAAGWFVFAQFCSEHAVWDRRSRRWARVGRDLELGAVVAAGPVFLFAGGETGPAGPGSGRLVAYNPG